MIIALAVEVEIYNFKEQFCKQFTETIAENNFKRIILKVCVCR